jgi:hypothetical protein
MDLLQTLGWAKFYAIFILLFLPRFDSNLTTKFVFDVAHF